jgi:hypothetical protein
VPLDQGRECFLVAGGGVALQEFPVRGIASGRRQTTAQAADHLSQLTVCHEWLRGLLPL